jgi:hypothetical protein
VRRKRTFTPSLQTLQVPTERKESADIEAKLAIATAQVKLLNG